MKKLFFLIATSATILCCSDDNEPSDNGIDQNQIVGQWKLIYLHEHSWDSYVFDFRKKNIVYDYRPNGILVVNGDGDPNAPHTDGQHDYSFVKETLSGQRDRQLIVNIDDEKWTYAFSDGQMTISLAYLDGGTLTFIRK